MGEAFSARNPRSPRRRIGGSTPFLSAVTGTADGLWDSIDFFYHDSDHIYNHVMFEFH
jgi:hypothetical protein